jgi:hypothetical protein
MFFGTKFEDVTVLRFVSLTVCIQGLCLIGTSILEQIPAHILRAVAYASALKMVTPCQC